jgi:hypothetical protein
LRSMSWKWLQGTASVFCKFWHVTDWGELSGIWRFSIMSSGLRVSYSRGFSCQFSRIYHCLNWR